MRRHEREAALRAAVASQLTASGMTQTKISSLLGISQGAVSQYAKGVRGSKPLDISAVSGLCKDITENNLSASEVRERLKKISGY